MTSLQERVTAAKRTVPIHTFTLPAGIANGIETVGIKEITTREEERVANRSRKNDMKLGFELVKQAIVEVNGQSVSLADGSTDRVWEDMGPRARTLMVAAYQEVNHPTDDQMASFLKSQTVKVT